VSPLLIAKKDSEMTDSTNAEAARLVWGEGKSISVVDKYNGRFELTFEGEVPSTKKIKVDSIDLSGKIRPLLVLPVVNGSTVTVTGQTDAAQRVRIYLIEDEGPQVREAVLPGHEQMKYVSGPEGGSLVFIGHDGESATAEVVPMAPGTWKLVFVDEGVKIRAPAVVDVEVEAIGADSARDQVRRLTVAPGPDIHSLLATGQTEGAAYIRLAIRDGNHWHTRSVPLLDI
jgi:hypothetical protein